MDPRLRGDDEGLNMQREQYYQKFLRENPYPRELKNYDNKNAN